MFGFLKDKLKGIVSKFSKKIDEEAKTIEEAPKEEPAKKIEDKKPETKPIAKPEPKPETKPEPKLEPRHEPKPIPKPEPKEEPATKREEKKPEPTPQPKEEPKPVIEEEKQPPKPEPKVEPISEPEQKVVEKKPEPKAKPEEAPKEEPTIIKIPEKEKHGFFDFLKKHPQKEEEAAPEEGKPKKEAEQPAEKPAEKLKDEHKEKKPEPKHEFKPTPKPEPKPELRPEPKSKPEPTPKPESKSPVEEPKEAQLEPEPEREAEKETKKGIFSILKEKITKKELNEKQFEEMFWDLEMILLENNVAVEVIDKIKEDLKKSLVNKPLERNRLDEIIESTLKRTIEELFDVEAIDLIEKARSKKPFIICVVGINGSGKTTSIAKVINLLKKNGLSSVIAASDTFRAAAIQQLEEHANNLNVKMIKHDYGADSAAVAFDAISYAKAHNIDVVLIDTAGRLQSNTNLMDELKKVKRITKPDLVIFVGESITGNDCVEQAKTFDSEIGIDGIILAKADIDEKGGAAISISYVTRKPILYLGTGQGYDDLIKFDPKIIMESLGLEG